MGRSGVLSVRRGPRFRGTERRRRKVRNSARSGGLGAPAEFDAGPGDFEPESSADLVKELGTDRAEEPGAEVGGDIVDVSVLILDVQVVGKIGVIACRAAARGEPAANPVGAEDLKRVVDGGKAEVLIGPASQAEKILGGGVVVGFGEGGVDPKPLAGAAKASLTAIGLEVWDHDGLGSWGFRPNGSASRGRGSSRRVDPYPVPMGTPAQELWCEACGYPLMGVLEGVRCPECGAEACLSDPARRTGSRWQRGAGPWALAVSGAAALTSPRRFWDVVTPDRRSGRWLAAAHAVAAGGLGVGTVAVIQGDVGLALTLLPLAVGAVWVMTVVETMGIMFWGRVHGARVTRDIAWAVCGHAAVGWTIGGALAAFGWVVGQLLSDDAGFRVFGSGRFKATGALASPVLVVVGAVAGMLLFETLTYLGVRRMRYANHAGAAPGAGGSSGESR